MWGQEPYMRPNERTQKCFRRFIFLSLFSNRYTVYLWDISLLSHRDTTNWCKAGFYCHVMLLFVCKLFVPNMCRSKRQICNNIFGAVGLLFFSRASAQSTLTNVCWTRLGRRAGWLSVWLIFTCVVLQRQMCAMLQPVQFKRDAAVPPKGLGGPQRVETVRKTNVP